MTTKATKSTGWNTARCTSLGQHRHWQEIVEMMPPSHRREHRARETVDRVDHQQHTDTEPEVGRVQVRENADSDRNADDGPERERPRLS